MRTNTTTNQKEVSATEGIMKKSFDCEGACRGGVIPPFWRQQVQIEQIKIKYILEYINNFFLSQSGKLNKTL
jgi:hypothetical protein